MSGDDSSSRTIVFGFDALDFRYLDRYRESLPNFERLREGGFEAPLRSTHPPWTGSAWPSMYTGVDPSYHGAYGFFRYDGYPDQGELISRADVAAPAIWDFLSTEGVPSVVLNVPITHPAEPIEGVMIPGYIAQETVSGHPSGIREEVSGAIDEQYRIYSHAEKSSDGEERLKGYLDLIDTRKQAAKYLVREKEWEFAFVQVQKTDAVVHNFDDDAAFRQVYEAADDLMGTVLEEIAEPVNVIVCSDHGIGPVRGHRIFVNELLRRGGYLETTEGGATPSLGGRKSELVGETVDDDRDESWATQMLSTVVDTLGRAGITPGRVYRTTTSLGVPPAVFKRLPEALVDATSKQVDWRQSRAYCRRHTRLGIRINLEGREPDGVVAPSEYEQVQREIVDLLERVETPDGQPAFDSVVRRQEFYDGPLADHGPDVVVRPRDMDNSLSDSLYGGEFVGVDKHDHKLDGVFVASGPAFDEDFEAERLSLTDVAPVVLAAMGRPVPERMTGTAPRDLLAASVRVRRFDDVPYARGSLHDQSSDGEVTERLEDLGYL
ncbi:alkaline phosphatase family protein [Haloarcula marina]|uniref:alkaline phosphatase family protein n=1 Tax=Haloarcula marina TaxID=2961574 RepID=UPI0020B7526A|nr:alkaline phosphatase family protein [Halomicroarcula marina]